LVAYPRRAYRHHGSDFRHVITVGNAPVSDIETAFVRLRERSGLEESVTPHALRHTCGTWMGQAGVPLWEIAGYLGHSIARTSELYAHHHPDHMSRARASLEGNAVTNSMASDR